MKYQLSSIRSGGYQIEATTHSDDHVDFALDCPVVRVSSSRAMAEAITSELNRLAAQRDALLEACKQARAELAYPPERAAKTLDEAIRRAEGGAA